MGCLYTTGVVIYNKKEFSFAVYYNIEKYYFTEDKWRKSVQVRSYWLLRSLKNVGSKGSKQEGFMEYRTPCLRTQEYIFNKGRFVTNNLQTAAVILGLIPLQ